MKSRRHPVFMRSARPEDLPEILRVEESWPEGGRAGADKFVARLERFPEGFLLACIQEEGAEKVVGTITSMPASYDPSNLADYGDWARVTNNGYLFDSFDPACNALYIVSGVIDARYRGLDIFAPAVLAEVSVAQAHGLRYVIAGAVIPGYAAYCAEHGEIDAASYCAMRRGRKLVDPLLAMYEAIGFVVPDGRHVIAGYYPDAPSRDYAALVVRELM